MSSHDKRIIYTAIISWGWLVYLLIILLIAINLSCIYLAGKYLQIQVQEQGSFNISLIAFMLPIAIIDFMFFSAAKETISRIFGKPQSRMILYNNGIGLKDGFFPWDQIKSISFNTGRSVRDYDFFRGLKLPALQRIYLLDTEGNEFSTVIDIDYSFKPGREKNNLRMIKELLHEHNKIHILSDWAQQ